MFVNAHPSETAERHALLQKAVATGILSRLDEVVPEARKHILEEQPSYRHMTPVELDDVGGLLHRNFHMVASAMSGHRVIHGELDYVVDHVRRRVHSGIPLDAVMRAYRTGFNVFWEECTAEVASLGLPRDAAVALARTMSEAMDTLTTHAAAAYVREESYLKSVDEKAARDLLDALLRGDVDAERVEPHAAAPGLDPQTDLVVVVGRISADTGTLTTALDRTAAALGDALSTRRASPLLVVRERAIVAVVPAGDPDREIVRLNAARRTLKEATGINLYCGVSPPSRGFAAVAAAYEQASLAVTRATEERPIVSLAALPALQHLLTGATGATRSQLLEKAQVITQRGPKALATMHETLHCFAEANLNLTRAAEHLMIHENTLRYRLRRIREQTGHNPQTFSGLVELICLLEVLDHNT